MSGGGDRGALGLIYTKSSQTSAADRRRENEFRFAEIKRGNFHSNNNNKNNNNKNNNSNNNAVASMEPNFVVIWDDDLGQWKEIYIRKPIAGGLSASRGWIVKASGLDLNSSTAGISI